MPDKKYSAKKVVAHVQVTKTSLSSVTLGKDFVECFSHSAKQLCPVVLTPTRMNKQGIIVHELQPMARNRDGNGYSRPDIQWVFTPLGYVYGLNILPICLLLDKNLHPMGK